MPINNFEEMKGSFKIRKDTSGTRTIDAQQITGGLNYNALALNTFEMINPSSPSNRSGKLANLLRGNNSQASKFDFKRTEETEHVNKHKINSI